MKLAHFRFYASLNDFLEPKNRQKTIAYSFLGSPTVKDAIQAMGIPHVEVHMILVNSTSTDFSYRVMPQDYISVYPLFKKLQLSGKTSLSSLPTNNDFIVDTHLGKLARYLRMLGFDTLYENDFTDAQIIDLSNRDGRIILTRDLGILKQNKVKYGYFLRNTDPDEQLREVVSRFDLSDHFHPFSRCLVCNGHLVPVKKDLVAQKIPPRTFKDYNEFYRCTGCDKTFWKGSHYDRMTQVVNSLLH